MLPEKSAEQIEFEYMARNIHGNPHLKAIIRSTKPALRREVYELLLPHLQFKPKPLLLLK